MKAPTIADGWDDLRQTMIADGIREAVIGTMRAAFYAGALFVLNAICLDEADPTDLVAEVVEFTEDEEGEGTNG